jgi:hypothetical protein
LNPDGYRDAKVREWKGFEGKKKCFLCCFFAGCSLVLYKKSRYQLTPALLKVCPDNHLAVSPTQDEFSA